MSKFLGNFCINLTDNSFIISVYTCILLEMILIYRYWVLLSVYTFILLEIITDL